MTIRSLTLGALATGCALVVFAVSASAPALALTGHAFSTSFSGSGEHALSDPQGVAVDQVNGEVYVLDSGHSRIEAFDSEGNFLFAFGGAGRGNGKFAAPPRQIAVDSSGPLPGDVYVLDGSGERLEVFNAPGEYLRQIKPSDLNTTKPMDSIAVDSHGNPWLNVDGHVFEAGPGGTLPAPHRFEQDSGSHEILALDAAGDLYFAAFSSESPFIEKYKPSGELMGSYRPESLYPCHEGVFLCSPCQSCVTATATDPVNESLYVDRGTTVVRFPAGSFNASDSFGGGGSEALVNGTGVAVVGSTNRVYVADAGSNRVDVFEPIALPSVSVTPATNVTRDSAILNGVVNPEEIAVDSCQFEWKVAGTGSFNVAPCSPSPGAGSSPVSVSTEASLAGGTSYYYRITVTSTNGTTVSPVEEVMATLPAVDALSTGAAEGITASSAKLTGALSPDGLDTHYYFEYGPTDLYGSMAPALPGTDAGSESKSVVASTVTTGLMPATGYHYRLVGVNSLGVTRGLDQHFETDGAPTVKSESAEVAAHEQAGQTSATLEAAIVPNGVATTYQFEYGETPAYGSYVPVSPGALGSGREPVTVPPAALSGLNVGTTYHYRVVASNQYDTVDGPDQQFTTLSAAVVEDFATDVTATSATLSAQINPLGNNTTAYFQYGTVSCTVNQGSCASAPLPPGTDLGESEIGQSLNLHLQELSPGTTYHYRVLVSNSVGTVESEDATFTTQALHTGAAMLDSRAWEMVSPPQKQGAGLEPIGGLDGEGGLIQAAADGSAITYIANAPVESDPQGSRSPETTQMFSRRQSTGWSTREIDTPHRSPFSADLGHPSEYLLFSSDLSQGVVQPPEPSEDATALSDEASERTPYLRHNTSCEASPATCYEPLVDGANVAEEVKFGGTVNFAGASPDMAHVILSSTEPLTPEIVFNTGSSLFEWSDGRLQLVSVLPDGRPTTETKIEAVLGAGQVARNAVSTDGSRVVWSSTDKEIFLRDVTHGETVKIDAANGVPEPEGPSERHDEYRTASSDGSRAFFTSNEPLVPEASANGNASDLYAYEVSSGAGEPLSGRLVDLTSGPSGAAQVKGVIGASEDGTYVYFVARGVLGDAAALGAGIGDNLYVEHYAEGAKAWTAPTFIAALAEGEPPRAEGDARDWLTEAGLASTTARVSPNGRYLAFMSQRSLTGYDNRDAVSGHPDEEVFLYDYAANRVVCASCKPTGSRPDGRLDEGQGPATESHPTPLVDRHGIWARDRWLAGLIPGWTGTEVNDRAAYQSRYLSNNGRLFFDSSDALVPQDANGNWDVYEYEPEGVGDCRSVTTSFSEHARGCLGLISSGGSAEESVFLDAGENGEDVFFLTTAKLVSADTDNSLDVYDARACAPASSCLAPAPVSPPPCSTSDSCKAAPSPQPETFGAPSSETFTGTGNAPGAGAPSAAVKSKSLTAAQKLARALKACHSKKNKRKRVACEKQARKRYAARAPKAKAIKSLSASRGR